MKALSNFKRLFFTLLIAIPLMSLSAQEAETNALSDFKIVIEKTQEGVNMQCIKGCSWNQLGFSLNFFRPIVYVDKNGMADKDSAGEFLFKVTGNKKLIILEGLEGTAWTELTMTHQGNQKWEFDQFGTRIMN